MYRNARHAVSWLAISPAIAGPEALDRRAPERAGGNGNGRCASSRTRCPRRLSHDVPAPNRAPARGGSVTAGPEPPPPREPAPRVVYKPNRPSAAAVLPSADASGSTTIRPYRSGDSRRRRQAEQSSSRNAVVWVGSWTADRCPSQHHAPHSKQRSVAMAAQSAAEQGCVGRMRGSLNTEAATLAAVSSQSLEYCCQEVREGGRQRPRVGLNTRYP